MICTVCQNRLPTELNLACFSSPRAFMVERIVPMMRKPLSAFNVSPRVGMRSSRRSIKGSSVLIISFGARSTSSIRIHRPSFTAVVKTPGFHTKDPGVEPEEYMPISIFASLCSLRWSVIIDCDLLSCCARCFTMVVFPEPGGPTKRIGSVRKRHWAV